ncbi:MAG: beta-N-acetylglucosaminidase domain-containing protein [Halieaceae bacterium]|jgi:hypothetical protein|nr:beta-N-acetylglucosaminidase domain-containing protein [Halieaceae bacterium]
MRLGVIEGFYGRAWDDAVRLRMIDWCARLGFDAYLYAPKADACLRRRWSEPWPDEEIDRLRALVHAGDRSGLEVVVGLSPFELYRSYDTRAQRLLRDCLARISDAGVRSLALLFDDMPGSIDALAARQADIVNDAAGWAPWKALRVCPTYYSDDEVLDRVFGERPEAYLEDLGAKLPRAVSIFWTGPRVCSERVSVRHVAGVAERLQRPVALWDNYPVNDSRLRSGHLYLAALDSRDPGLADHLESHWCNAMNQAALSLPALASLPALFGRSGAIEQVLDEAGVSPALIDACLPLAAAHLDELTPPKIAELRCLAAAPGQAAIELGHWLDGVYRFDPACLTD